MDDDDYDPTLGERLRNIAFIIVGAALSIGLVTLQVLATGVGCWFWAC